nr:uncharacterized protein LOC112098917 [Ipomoea batatas]
MCSEDDNSSDAFQQLDMVDEHVLTGDCSSFEFNGRPGTPRFSSPYRDPSIMRVYRPSPPFSSLYRQWRLTSMLTLMPQMSRLSLQRTYVFGFGSRSFNDYAGGFDGVHVAGGLLSILQAKQSPRLTQIHPVFHVSLPTVHFRGPDSTLIMPLPTTLDDGRPVSVPVAIHEHRQVLRHGVLEEQSVGAMEWHGRPI